MRTSGISASSNSSSGTGNPFADLPRFLPQYLVAPDQLALSNQLKEFPNNNAVYADLEPPYAMQGDVWTNFSIRDWATGDKRLFTAIVFSNSCDIATDNNPPPHQKIMFSPTLSLQKYENLLKAAGRTQEQISNSLREIRRQQDSGILYLPGIGNRGESLVLLDHVFCQPLSEFNQVEKQRISALSQYGFYVFLVKLSVHFLRIREGIRRG